MNEEMTEKDEESGTEEETENKMKTEDDENIDVQDSAEERTQTRGKREKRLSPVPPNEAKVVHLPKHLRHVLERRLLELNSVRSTSLPVKKLLPRVIVN